MSDDKPDLQWIQDSSGVSTCHINDGSLKPQQSLVGTLDYRNDGWHVILKDKTDLTPEGVPSLARAREAMVLHFRKTKADSVTPQGKEEETQKPDRMTPRIAQKGRI